MKLLQSCFYEIARNKTVQTELICEIDVVNASLEGSLSYEAVNSMKFLDMVIHETIRRSPPIPFGTRICTKDCTVTTSSGELLKFKTGDVIHLPFKLLQHDTKYYSNPGYFDPSRFVNEQSKQNLLAFGLGPRNCLGSQIVLIQLKILIFTLLRKYSVKTDGKSSNENFHLEFNSR